MATHDVSVELSDDQKLARLGKKQVLKRRFGFWSLFGFAVCELITRETVMALFTTGLENGGPAGLVYGFIIAWSSTLSVYMVISELASMAPIAAGQYYWAYILAPEKNRVFVSYVIGWLTTLAWIATMAIECLFAGTMLQGIVTMDYPTYTATLWQGTLLTWMVLAVNMCINMFIPGLLPRIEIGVVVFHISGFVAIITVLWYFSPINDASFVFTTSLNEGGWSSQGLSYCIGFLGNVATFVGADASVHMAEEVTDASTTIPRAIIASMLVNGAVGFTMMLTLLFCIGDVDKVLDSATGFPFMQIFLGKFNTYVNVNSTDRIPDNVPNLKGSTTMAAVVLILTWACALGITTSASRMTWSFARDQGLPLSKLISRVSKTTRVPLIAIGICVLLAALLSCIYIGSPTAYNDIVSLTVTGFYGSYFIPAALLLYHRLKGNILPHEMLLQGQTQTQDAEVMPSTTLGTEEKVKDERTTTYIPSTSPAVTKISAPAYVPTNLYWGPWHIPGILGTLNNIYACAYMIFVIFWSVWPTVTPVDAESMNYSVVVTGGVVILSMIWYFVKARHVYRGPLVEVSEIRGAILGDGTGMVA